MSRDPIVNAVIDMFEARSDEGMQRYGMSMAGNPKTPLQWLEDAQEELMDAVLYLQAVKASSRPEPRRDANLCYMCGGQVVHLGDGRIYCKPQTQQSRLECLDCGAEFTVDHGMREFDG